MLPDKSLPSGESLKAIAEVNGTRLCKSALVNGLLSAKDAEMLEGSAAVHSQEVVNWYREVVVPAREGASKSMIEQRTYSL